MVDDPADPDAPVTPDEDAQPPPAPPPSSPPPLRGATPPPRSAAKRTLLLWGAFVVPLAVIVLALVVIMKSAPPRGSPESPPVAVLTPSAATLPSSLAALLEDSAPALGKSAPAEQDFDEQGSDEKPTAAKPARPKHFATVEQAALGSCTTESVDGLSRQIIAHTRCIDPSAVVPLEKRPNLVLTPHVFPYLELEARDHLLRALDQHAALTMTVNSALRTVAQQYLVWRWAASKTCGVQLATLPGESNHEIGAALDIAEAPKWRSALEREAFRWLGSSDRVHFDFKGNASPARAASDVLAFQKLWNENHRADAIPESGKYDAATEQRLKKAPADGFPRSPSCRGKARVR